MAWTGHVLFLHPQVNGLWIVNSLGTLSVMMGTVVYMLRDISVFGEHRFSLLGMHVGMLSVMVKYAFSFFKRPPGCFQERLCHFMFPGCVQEFRLPYALAHTCLHEYFLR